jgi:hypothetical protein
VTVRPISIRWISDVPLKTLKISESQSADQGTCLKCVALTANVALVNNGWFSLVFTLRRHVTGTFQLRADLSNGGDGAFPPLSRLQALAC